MKFVVSSSVFLLLTIASSFSDAHSDSHSHTTDVSDWKLKIKFLTSRLPTAKSDMSVNIDNKNIVYLTGGCDHPQGNTNLGGFYGCTSITNEHIGFDADSETVLTNKLASAPRPRYRHTSVLHENKIYLIGGRNNEDAIINELDVYDISSDSWSSASLPLNATNSNGDLVLMTSDLFAFVDSEAGMVYYGGGYDADYTARDEVYSFQISDVVVGSDTDVNVQREEQLTLLEARGDAHAVLYKGKVYLTGGFTHANGFCAPLTSVESVDLNDMNAGWKQLDDLGTGRGDKALVAMNDYLFAIGGEGTVDCGTPVAYDDVEVLDLGETDGKWIDLGSLPNERFRFVAAAHPTEDAIYTFGGQEFYNTECDCYATSDLIAKFTYEVDEGSSGLPTGAVIGIILGVLFVVVLGYYVYLQKKRNALK